MVSPLFKPYATNKVITPVAADNTFPIPYLKIRSTTKPNNTAAQPMKTAEEYKLITGARPVIVIRQMIATV